MKKKPLSGSKVYWLAVGKQAGDGLVFSSRADAVKAIERTIGSWADYRLLQCSAFVEWRP